MFSGPQETENSHSSWKLQVFLHPFSGSFDWICLSPKKKSPPLARYISKGGMNLKSDCLLMKPITHGQKENAALVKPLVAELFLQPEWKPYEGSGCPRYHWIYVMQPPPLEKFFLTRPTKYLHIPWAFKLLIYQHITSHKTSFTIGNNHLLGAYISFTFVGLVTCKVWYLYFYRGITRAGWAIKPRFFALPTNRVRTTSRQQSHKFSFWLEFVGFILQAAPSVIFNHNSSQRFIEPRTPFFFGMEQ